MSRPPNHDAHPSHLSSAYDNRNGLIDFVNVPISNLNQSYAMEEVHPSIYAQAGFPGYGVVGAPMVPAVYHVHPSLGAGLPQSMGPAMPPTLGASMPAYNQQLYHAQVYPTPLAAPAFLEPTPVESEAVLHQRINDKIDDIIRAQKDSMLHSRIESLSNKVDQLSHNFVASSSNEGSDASHIHRLSEKVQQLSQSLDMANERRLQAHLESMDRPHTDRDSTGFMNAPFSAPSDPSDAEISRRLRRLAAESSMRQRAMEAHSDKIPDW